AEPNGGTLLRRIRDAGQVRVGFANEAPYSYVDSHAEFTGESAELARIVFGRLGVDSVLPVPTEFGSLIAGLKVGLFDVIGAGLAILPDRCRQVLFTNPEFVAPEAFLVRNGNPKGVHNFVEAAENPRVRIGVLDGAAEEGYARSAGVDTARITGFSCQSDGLGAVHDGRVDAFASPTVALRYLLARNPDVALEATEPFLPIVNGKKQFTAGAFAFLPDQRNIVREFNIELGQLKKSGQLFEILRPFGFTDAEMTDISADQLCSTQAA
ncbi:MAG: ectoine/hydroxyectoine ABC transporter substrate-binding protein EhuB, partial [Sciscionella sp.]